VFSLRVLYWTHKAPREDNRPNQPNGCPNWWEFWCCGPGTISPAAECSTVGKCESAGLEAAWAETESSGRLEISQ